MRKVMLVVGLAVLFAAGVGTGYLLAGRWWLPGATDGGLYKDDEVAAMRPKLSALTLPISSDDVFRLLEIDRKRLGEPQFHGWGNGGNQVSLFTWRLSPTFGLAMYEEQGPDFGPPAAGKQTVTHLAIGKCIPAPGHPSESQLVVLDETDKEQTEIRLLPKGKGVRLAYWNYPHVSKTVKRYDDPDGITGGFACLTADDFDQVVAFYSEKCGVDKEAMQITKGETETKEGKGGPMTFRGYDGEPANAAMRVRCLNLKRSGYEVSICVVRAQGDKETQIFLNLW